MKRGGVIAIAIGAAGALAALPFALMLVVLVMVSGPAGTVTCGPAVPTADNSPTILGPSALNADQIAAWWHRSGRAPLTPTGAAITILAGWYVDHGAAEGVRGDIAFAQAVAETTQDGLPFNSAAAHRNNFAGIGITGPTATGYLFPDPETGVVAQLQLLREVALGNGGPFAEARVAPSWGGRPASTWAGLAGNWATAPDYWTAISRIYREMAGGSPAMVPDPGCRAGHVLAGLLSGGNLAPMWAFLTGQLGKPYQWGGTGPDSWDCSGLVMVAWGQVGLSLPRTAAQQYLYTQAAAVSPSALQPGDLVFWSSGPGAASIDHVAIYVGSGQVLDAPHTGAVVQIQQMWTRGLFAATRPAIQAVVP